VASYCNETWLKDSTIPFLHYNIIPFLHYNIRGKVFLALDNVKRFRRATSADIGTTGGNEFWNWVNQILRRTLSGFVSTVCVHVTVPGCRSRNATSRQWRLRDFLFWGGELFTHFSGG